MPRKNIVCSLLLLCYYNVIVYYITVMYKARNVLLQRSLPIAKQAMKVHKSLVPYSLPSIAL